MRARSLVAASVLFSWILLSLASGQEIKAWKDLDFADSPKVVQQKMVAMQKSNEINMPRDYAGQSYTDIARFPRESFYPVMLGGVDLGLTFDFYDNKLYRLTFLGSSVSADLWDAVTLKEYKTLEEVLQKALGAPYSSHSIQFLDMRRGFINYGAIWHRKGATYRLGIAEGDATYDVNLVVEWDWMTNLVADQSKQEHLKKVKQGAEGF